MHIELVPKEIWERIPTSGGSLVVLRNIRVLDVCAGRARISRWASMAGLATVAIDRDYSEHMDINTAQGFALVIMLLLRTCSGGLLFLAAQCST